MKKIIKSIITEIKNLLCLSIHIQVKANRKSDFILVDRLVFSPFLKKEKEVDLFILKINPASFFYKVPMGSCFIIK